MQYCVNLRSGIAVAVLPIPSLRLVIDRRNTVMEPAPSPSEAVDSSVLPKDPSSPPTGDPIPRPPSAPHYGVVNEIACSHNVTAAGAGDCQSSTAEWKIPAGSPRLGINAPSGRKCVAHLAVELVALAYHVSLAIKVKIRLRRRLLLRHSMSLRRRNQFVATAGRACRALSAFGIAAT